LDARVSQTYDALQAYLNVEGKAILSAWGNERVRQENIANERIDLQLSNKGILCCLEDLKGSRRFRAGAKT